MDNNNFTQNLSENIFENVSAAEEQNNSVASSDWTKKLFFDRSFSAKLILSDEKIKEYYAEIAGELLSYGKIRSKTGWNGVSFIAGRNRLAYISINGKTLCLYLALAPENFSEGKYKVKDVSDVKTRAKTPSLLKIKSVGAKKRALSLILAMAEKFGFEKEQPQIRIDPANFKTDSFNNLITRGLIRVLKTDRKPVSPLTDESEDEAEVNFRSAASLRSAENAYEDTVLSLANLVSRHGIFNDYAKIFTEGSGKIGLFEKRMLRSIDEIWVRAIEDCISSLDELIRNPNHYIAETEEVLPIELTKRISGRSISHLCRHTDYIAQVENGEIKPAKMLNVFRDDSLFTYENKFLNTLINRLYLFVNKRFKIAQEYGADETIDYFEFENSFTHGEGKGRIKISVEYSEKNLDKNVKSALIGTGLWKRVERLNDIVTGYANSSFVKSMDRSFVRPPVMRTNAILKNKYFRECLALWEFIESYEDAGYGITVEEKIKDVSDEYVADTYAAAQALYLMFRHNAKCDGEEISALSEFKPLYNPEVFEPDETEEEFYEDLDENEIASDDIELAIKVALKADEWLDKNKTDAKNVSLKKSFRAKLALSCEDLKENFASVCNEFAKFNKVKLRFSSRYASFYSGRTLLLKAAVVSEKTLKLYFALNASALPEKYKVKDVSDKAGYIATPAMLVVKSKRAAKYASEIIAIVCNEYGLTKAKMEQPLVTAADYPVMSVVEMIEQGWIKIRKTEPFSNENAELFEPEKHFITGFNKNKFAEVASNEASRLAVKEWNRESVFKNEETQRKNFVRANTITVSERLDNIIRPDGNYQKPTDYGVDDASGFLKDSASADETQNKNE